MTPALTQHATVDAVGLAAAIAATDRSASASTVVGYGTMGKQYVKALGALGVRRIRVVSRSAGPLDELSGLDGAESIAGGFERLTALAEPEELGVVAVPTAQLMPAAERLASLGFRHLLIEKPVALWSRDIERLADALEGNGVEAACGYNRVAYPAAVEAAARAAREGGITSCTYTFTEMIKPDWVERFPAEELARWGIANSLHPISLAHALIGMPATWSAHRQGSLSWHPTGTVFVGSGFSEGGVPFAYHADWGSTGRWSVEVHTHVASYLLCPLERLFRKSSALGDWEEVPITVFAPEVKAGLVEEVAAMLHPSLRAIIPLVSIREAARLAAYAEDVFGYQDHG